MRTMMDDAVESKVIGPIPVPTQAARRRGKFKGKSREDTTVIATPRQVYLMACNARGWRGLSGYALVLTLAYVGLRIAEAAGLRRDDVSSCRRTDPPRGSCCELSISTWTASPLRSTANTGRRGI
jgi:integrase